MKIIQGKNGKIRAELTLIEKNKLRTKSNKKNVLCKKQKLDDKCPVRPLVWCEGAVLLNHFIGCVWFNGHV